MLATDADSGPLTNATNASKGAFTPSTGTYTWTPSESDVGTYLWTFYSNDSYGGSDSETITVTVTEILTYIPPTPSGLAPTQNNFWVNYTWSAGGGNITDSYNVSHNSIWSNDTITFRNNTVGPHGWSNISVYAYNNSGTGQLSQTPATMNTQVTNNVPVLGSIGYKTVTAGNLLSFTILVTDADSDPLTNATNASKGAFTPSTGTYTWTPIESDVGTYLWTFYSNDSYGGSDSETITVTVTEIPAYIPAAPLGLASTQNNFWVNYTWSAGGGNITDSYNVSHNSIWSNNTITFRNNTVGPHGWSNISVYAYNNSGTGQLSQTPATMNTQVTNNVPVLGSIGDKTVTAGNLLSFTMLATDADSDPLTNSTNASKGAFTPSTGIYTWTPSESDVGTYLWTFYSNDSYGGSDSETITVTVKSMPAYNVSGYVFDNFGSGLVGVLVQNGSNQITTSASGYYSITNLTNGNYSFSYSKAGFNTDYFEITINGADNTSANKTIYDTAPPASINNIAAASTPLYVNWTWTDASDSDLDHVEVYIDSAFKTNLNKGVEFYNASYFEPNSTHMISTRTVDNYGNVNSTWVNDTVITPSLFTYVFNFLINTGTVSNFGNTQNADGAVSTFAEVQGAGENKSNRTMNPVKTITNGTQNNTYNSSYFDNLDGLIDNTIPEVSGTSETIYLVSTAKTGMGGTTYWNLNATHGG